MARCGHCGGSIEQRFRFCPWCAAPQRLKLVEFFRPHPGIEADRHKVLRVSRYLGGDPEEHVRLSVWHESAERAEADAAVSLAGDEAGRLGRFLLATPAPGVRGGLRSRFARLRRSTVAR